MQSAIKKLALPALFFLIGLIVANVALSVHQVGIEAVLSSKFAVVLSGVGGAMIAACISVYGVRSANKSSLDRLSLQHDHDLKQATDQREHDARQKTEDRKAAIRREVYTKAVEAVHELIAQIGALHETPVHTDNLTPALQKFIAANSKVWLVAEPKAAHLSRELVNRFMELIFVAVPESQPYRSEMEPIRDLDTKLVQAKAELHRIETRIAEAKERNESGEIQHALAESFERAGNWTRTLKQARETAHARLLPQKKALIRKMLAEQKPVQELIVEVVSALRAELDLPPDYELFKAQHEDQYQRVLAAITKAFGDPA